jgi:hypothetical protein
MHITVNPQVPSLFLVFFRPPLYWLSIYCFLPHILIRLPLVFTSAFLTWILFLDRSFSVFFVFPLMDYQIPSFFLYWFFVLFFFLPFADFCIFFVFVISYMHCHFSFFILFLRGLSCFVSVNVFAISFSFIH